MMAVETRFADAERQRLLYVATTRAMQELVVTHREWATTSGPKPDVSAWSPLAPTLDVRARVIELETTAAAGRRVVEMSTGEVQSRIDGARERLARAAVPSVHLRTVREVTKADPAVMQDGFLSATGGRGANWGSAVHKCIEAMGRGRTRESLQRFIHAVAAEFAIGADQLSELEAILERVRLSKVWRRLETGEMRHFELPMMYRRASADVEELLEGVADAAALAENQWLVADWKTDDVDVIEWTRRGAGYERQARLYADILEAMTGHTAEASVEQL